MKIQFAVQGMTCQRCVARVKAAAMSVAGVTNVEVALDTGKAIALFGAGLQANAPAIAKAITDAGYPAVAE
jgi:copper chaperone CopZ